MKYVYTVEWPSVCQYTVCLAFSACVHAVHSKFVQSSYSETSVIRHL